MQVCACCGSRNIQERATGVTTRAILKAAHDLSEGKNLVLCTANQPGRRLHDCQFFLTRVAEVASQFGYLVHQQKNMVQTLSGGILRIAYEGSTVQWRGQRPSIYDAEEITVV